MTKIGDYLYGYTVKEENDAALYYNTSLIRYDQELNEISSTPLGVSFHAQTFTGFSVFKNRVVYQYDENNIYSIVLNTPIFVNSSFFDEIMAMSYSNSDKYNMTKYRLTEENKVQDNSSSIINSIIKNPQTNSIIIITSFVLLILAISIISYVVYQKKTKNKS